MKIKFGVVEPICGGNFLRNSENENYFLKSNKISYTRSLFPCLDSIEDYYKISKIRIAVNRPEYQIFCYGTPKLVSKTQTMKIVDYEIEKVVNPNYLCLVSGPFHRLMVPVDRKKVGY